MDGEHREHISQARDLLELAAKAILRDCRAAG
jgi:hypothetical protein